MPQWTPPWAEPLLGFRQPRPFPVVFFRTEGGNEPAREWLKGLPADERRAIGEDLMTLQFR